MKTIDDTAPVVIGVDPHKASWTAVAIDAGLGVLGSVRVPVTSAGYRQLRRFAGAWPDALWAIEGAGGLGAGLSLRLDADGVAALDVPAKLAARVRTLSGGHGRKSDPDDALSVAIAAAHAPGLRHPNTDEAIRALRLLVEHRGDLVKHRTQTINRLHALLTQLIPGGARSGLTAQTAADLIRPLRPRDMVTKTARLLAADLIRQVRGLDKRIITVTDQIDQAVTATATSLTQLRGIGTITAATILARVGSITRFQTAAAFASYNGTAPIEVSSGEVVRHRLSRAGDRQLNRALHTMAITQIACDAAGRAY